MSCTPATGAEPVDGVAATSSDDDDGDDVFDMDEVSERRDRVYMLVLSAEEFLAVSPCVTCHVLFLHVSCCFDVGTCWVRAGSDHC